MFEINKHKAIVSDLPLITDNYISILRDENPILYSGTNRYGNRILGVIVEESEIDFSIRYFHVIIDDKTYYDFTNKKITLRHIIEISNVVFVIDTKGGKVIDNNLVTISEIPKDYLPLDDSYCPDGYFIPSLNFGVSLKGKKSDLHIVEVPDVNSIQTAFADVLKNALRNIDDLDLNPKCYLEPSKTGSYRVNYIIEFETKQASLFHVDDSLLAEYLKSLFNYIIEKLPNEQYTLKEDDITSDSFIAIEDALEKIYESSKLGSLSQDEIEEKVIRNVNETALKFEEVTNFIKNSSSFNKIELLNYQSTGGELGLGIIDENFFDSIKAKLIIKEPDVNVDIIEEEQSPQTYRIRVYHLNTDSGNCWAYFYPDNESESNFKIPIRIRQNDKEYHNSFLSKSLDEKKVISIKGYAERINKKVTSITVDL